MIIDAFYIERVEGANMIVEYCEDLADEFNLELVKTPYWVLPVIDAISVDESSDLIIETTLGSTKVKFSLEEIEDYPNRLGSEEVRGKIKGAFEILAVKS